MSFAAQRTFKVTHLHSSSALCRRWSNVSDLREQLTKRRLPPIYDYITPIPSLLLEKSISDVWENDTLNECQQEIEESSLPAPYHLIHFPPATRISSLFPDGTDPLHSPGPPFVRRMWAGGSISYDLKRPGLIRNGKPAIGTEQIVDVQVKGNNGNEKIYVGIDRKFHMLEHVSSIQPGTAVSEPALTERRNLVFMREETDPAAKSKMPSRMIKVPYTSESTRELTPSRDLLFRFSALTFNAHSIHLSKEFCSSEGYRNLLVHGPLSLTLMVIHLMNHVRKGLEKGCSAALLSIEYRNLAPLFAEEKLRLCLRKICQGPADVEPVQEDVYEVWCEGPEGGLAVRGTAKVLVGLEATVLPQE